ncbi:ABC transporter ATP-binding protein [Sporosalibacterium faouarense]|uniref:ABC transporter ATP-binding protein n=1 Tax=Sporosalibacterium faouarense TaxID=516123 RepID=UPI00141D5A7E|nr:ABC transporter ATP-binding protein [Sporosalibacterium faouarense]MTI48539.1 ABC transporter ATP-binding protein [Bacillota bacterium]
MIEIRNIHKSYSNIEVLKDINLKINRGEFISLIGPSGCGKSTLINIVCGLDKPTKGKILINDKEIQGTDTDRIMVFQNAALFPWLTVKDNVSFGLKNLNYSSKEIEDKVTNILKKVHLNKFKNHYPHELSGGMKQRVSLARSLVMDPEILLMDEPFSALDEQTRLLLHNELQQIWMETKKTIIFVTHNIREAVKLSDKVIIMGTRPSRIIDEINIDISHPRASTNSDIYYKEQQVFKKLKKEIEKVAREELGYEYKLEKDNVPSERNNTMGGGI